MKYSPLIFLAAVAWSLAGPVSLGGADEGGADHPAELELATVCVDELCGYLNSRGQWRIPPRFTAADPFSQEGLAYVIIKDGLYKGRTISASNSASQAPRSPDDYKAAGSGGRGSSVAYTMTPYGGKIGVIDATGSFVDQSHFFAEIRKFSANGLAAASEGESGRWGFINTRSQWVIEPRFDYADSFAGDGRAVVTFKGKKGAVDAEGRWLIKPEYEVLSPFSKNGLAAAEYKGLWGLLKPKWGYLNSKGRWAIRPEYDQAGSFSDRGLARVQIGDKAGLIDAAGRWVIKPEFASLSSSFSDRGLVMARATAPGYWGLINTEGQWVVEPLFEDVREIYLKGPAAAKAGGKWGLINAEGQWVLEPKFERAGIYSEHGLTRFMSDGKWGLVEADGHWVLEPQFDDIGPFYHQGRLLFVVKINDKWGLRDAEGQWLIPPEIEAGLNFYDNGLAAVKLNGQYGIINALGQWLFQPEFKEVRVFSDRLAAVKAGGLYGLINQEGQWVVKPKFLDVYGPKKGGLAEVRGRGQGTLTRWANGQVDTAGLAYRTGLNETPEEPGFRWDFAGGLRTLYNRQDEKILTIERICGAEVAKNAAREIIWPLSGLAPVCEDKNEYDSPG